MKLVLVRRILTLLAVAAPIAVRAQRSDASARWAFSAAIGAGVADVPKSASPTYFDASQLTARVGAQRQFGAGLFGGVSLLATVGATGSDCIFGPCAPHVRQHVLSATTSYVHAGVIRRFIPIVSLAAGVARLPEQWASFPRDRTPAANTLSLTAAFDIPLYVRQRTALLLGWETGVIPNAPGDAIHVNALVLSLRHTRQTVSSRSCSSSRFTVDRL